MKFPIFIVLFSIITSGMIAQAPAAVDFTHMEAEISIETSKREVSGEIIFTFDILEATDSIFIDAQKMHFSEVFLNGSSAEFGNNGKKLWITDKFSPAKNQQIRLKYSTSPKQTMYFIRRTPETEAAEYQVWTQGQGKYTSHWLPSFDDITEKLEFDLSFIYPSGNTLIANGEMVEKYAINDSLTRWQFDMDNPMSSYLVAVAAGKYEKENFTSKSGAKIENYYPVGMENKVEPTYRHTQFIMDFFVERTGISYPWKNYKQIPVQDFLYAGMENTGTTIFSDLFMVDSIGFNDQNYFNVNAHELAHQWFGNFVTAESPEDHWLHEGFATYYALLAEKEIFGEDYYYRKIFKTAEELKQLSDSGKGEAILTGSGSSLTYYQKGAWALHILSELIGEEAFDSGVKKFLLKYQYGSATTQEFISEMEAASGRDLSEFKKDWLEQSAFQGTEALESLKQSPFIQKYLELAAAKPFPLSEKKNLLRNAFRFPVNDYLGQGAVLQLAFEKPQEVIDLYKKAFSSGNLFTRQTIAFTLKKIPQQLKSEYESLLDDESYLTIEAALYNLWMSFPDERIKYLKKVEGIEGLTNKNVRMLWLALSLATPEVDADSKKQYIRELTSSTAPHQKFQVRENAFGYLYQLNAFTDESISNLVEASVHHNSRFKDFSRKLIKTLIDEGQLKSEELEVLKEKIN